VGQPLKLSTFKTAHGSSGTNTLKSGNLVFLWLRFKDPDKKLCDFPAGLEVAVRFQKQGEAAQPDTVEILKDRGETAFPLQGAPGETWTLTLLFQCPQASPRFIVCGAPGSPPSSPPEGQSRLEAAAPAQGRFFRLPFNFSGTSLWGMRHSDWTPAVSGADYAPAFGSFADGVLTYTVPTPAKDLTGKDDLPVELVLDPHWMFFRFEYFDRYYGPATRSSPSTAGHGARIAIPPVELEGQRKLLEADADLADADALSTHSNWTVEVAGSPPAGGPSQVQCLPWILRKKEDGSTALPPLEGKLMLLRFKRAEHTFVVSSSATAREIKVVDPEPDPGPARLKYYRLPTVWKSKNYWARGVTGGTKEKFFGTLTSGEADAATAKDKALIFSLDDMVFTKEDRKTTVTLGADDRVMIFHHRFMKGSGCDEEGLYKADADVKVHGYPYSKVDIPVGARYYLHDYPDWTRLVVAQGNLFDAFDWRTTADCDVAGACAAVRWVVANNIPADSGGASEKDPRPTVELKPAADAKALFAFSPFHWQKFLSGYKAGNPESGPKKHLEWKAKYGSEKDQCGRLDIALLRCADWQGTEEIAVMVRFNRLSFNFVQSTAPKSNTEWVKLCIDGILARWNGRDKHNASPAWILPRPGSPAPPAVRVQVVNLFQWLKQAWAQFYLKTIPTGDGSSIGEIDGAGQLRVNCVVHDDGNYAAQDDWGVNLEGRGMASAHEMGHCGTLPDDYNSDSFNYTFLSRIGSPYSLEEIPGYTTATPEPLTGYGLMQHNWYIRARYLWHAAEWLRLVKAFETVDFKIEHGDENDFYLPHYPHTVTAGLRERNFVNCPLAFNLKANAGGKTLFDAALWLLGKDKYSTEVVQSRCHPGIGVSPPVATPAYIDGMLIVILRVQIDFSAVAGGAAAQKNIRKDLFDRWTAKIEPALNFQRFASFQLTGAGAVPGCKNCLLHFLPSLASKGITGTADTNVSTTKPHIAVTLSTSADAWNDTVDPRTLRLQITTNIDTAGNRNAQLNALATKIYQRNLELLGLSATNADANYYGKPGAYKPIVLTVMDDAVPKPPDPTIVSIT
jgi:hypothetical protein